MGHVILSCEREWSILLVPFRQWPMDALFGILALRESSVPVEFKNRCLFVDPEEPYAPFVSKTGESESRNVMVNRSMTGLPTVDGAQRPARSGFACSGSFRFGSAREY